MRPYRTLVDTETLFKHLDDPNWVVIDCRYDLLDPEAGRQAFANGHLPGARYADLDQDLSDPITPHTGRHPLPDPGRLAALLGEWGVGQDTQAVVYDDVAGAMAGRLWWLMRWLGHSAVAVLDGGLTHWQRNGLPLTSEPPRSGARAFVAKPEPDLGVDTASVLANLTTSGFVVVDARAQARFRGDEEPIDAVAGHIPSALNRPFQSNLQSDGRFKPVATLRTEWQELLKGNSPSQIVHMCGSGVSACHSILAMELLGMPGSRLYAGSWSEWIRDPQRPVATGDA